MSLDEEFRVIGNVDSADREVGREEGFDIVANAGRSFVRHVVKDKDVRLLDNTVLHSGETTVLVDVVKDVVWDTFCTNCPRVFTIGGSVVAVEIEYNFQESPFVKINAKAPKSPLISLRPCLR